MTGDENEAIRQRLSGALADLAGVRLAYLFGSRASGRARADSDIDVAVLLDPERVGGAEAYGREVRRLAGALGRVVSSASLDIVLLNEAPCLLRHRVLAGGRLLFARSEQERVRYAIRTIREYQDFEPRLRQYAGRRLARLSQENGDGRSPDLLEAARRVARLLDLPK